MLWGSGAADAAFMRQRGCITSIPRQSEPITKHHRNDDKTPRFDSSDDLLMGGSGFLGTMPPPPPINRSTINTEVKQSQEPVHKKKSSQLVCGRIRNSNFFLCLGPSKNVGKIHFHALMKKSLNCSAGYKPSAHLLLTTWCLLCVWYLHHALVL